MGATMRHLGKSRLIDCPVAFSSRVCVVDRLLAKDMEGAGTSMGATMRRLGETDSIDHHSFAFCSCICVSVGRFLARDLEDGGTNTGAMMRRRGEINWDRGSFLFLIWPLLSRPPPGQGYGERANEHGRYDAPSG